MRYPKFLKDGGSIGFVAPSFGCSIEPYRSAFDHALEVFHEMGYKTVCGPNVYASDGIGISSSPKNCGRELTKMYCSNSCDILISCGGGEMMCEIQDYLDYGRIARAKPKWYLGYSDNTNFTFLLPTLCDTAAIYGPCAPAFGMQPWHKAIEDTYLLLRGEKFRFPGYRRYEIESRKDEEHPLEPYNCTERRKILGFAPGEKQPAGKGDRVINCSGRLLGGCLDILVTLCGTRYDRVREFTEKYSGDGILWFFEACDLNVFGIRRAIWQLQHAGWFEHVSGFLIGRPRTGQEEMMGLDHIRAVTDLLAEYRVPILLDVDIGHLPPMLPLITGSLAEVSFRPADGSMKLRMQTK